MIPEYAFGEIFIATVPVNACVALGLAFIVHRILVALRFYRWVWHPILFDTAMFVVIWALLSVYPVPLP